MSHKLLVRGKRKLESELPLNQHIRLAQSQAESRAELDVPSDFREFAKLCRIRSGSTIIPFQIWDWQEELSDVADRFNVCCFKTRQVGCTEIFAAKMLHKACLSPAYSAAVLSLGGKETSKIAKRVRRMPSQIPGFSFSGNAVTLLEVKGGGFLTFCPSTDNAVRSIESVHDLLFDEAAFVPNIEEIYSSATPAQEMVGKDARSWVISTMSQQGKLSWFWSDMFDNANGNVDIERAIARAQEGIEPFQWWVDENGWAKVIMHWKAHPIYSQIPNYLAKVKREKKIPEDKLQREYNLGLPATGGSLFDMLIAAELAIGNWIDEPIPGRYYLAGVDPNFGGRDYYNLVIVDITEKPYSLVFQYRNNCLSTTYNSDHSAIILNRFKPVITVVEGNSGGKIVQERLITSCPSLAIESVWHSANSKIVHTDRLALSVESRELIYPADWEGCSTWVDDEGTEHPSEMSQFSASERKALSGSDDAIMSLAAAFSHLQDAVAEVKRLERLRSATPNVAGNGRPPQGLKLWDG
jgi:hypothetical protein